MVYHLIIILFLISPSFSFAALERQNYIAPSQLANTTREMKTAGFWVAQHPAPDDVIMTPEQIGKFNARIQDDLKLTKDIFAVTNNFKTESLIDDFNKVLNDLKAKGYYTKEGIRKDEKFLDEARENMNFPGVVLGAKPRYGLVMHYANVRFLPTPDPIYETNGDIDFDQLQNSSLDVGSAVAVAHQSLDKKWYYVFTSTADGWVEADRIVLGDMKAVKEYVHSPNFAVAIKPKSDVFLDSEMTRFHDHVRMGTKLPLNDQGQVLIPIINKEKKMQLVPGFFANNDFSRGYLSYTARHVLTQAFLMLNAPYGWGGMYGEQDCSAFLLQTFSTFGINFPRDSKDQAQVGTEIASLEKAVGGKTILAMKGHIMLYLGNVNKKPYAIHAVWAYREQQNKKDVPRVMNRVVVSDLSLGEGSNKGSLLKRLTKIIAIE